MSSKERAFIGLKNPPRIVAYKPPTATQPSKTFENHKPPSYFKEQASLYSADARRKSSHT